MSVGSALKTGAVVAVALILGIAAGRFVLDVDEKIKATDSLAPDRPPGEYLFLDTERVLAYLGQIEGGLTDAETRNASATDSESVALESSLGADIKASRQKQRSVEEVVKPNATDRFFKLLIKLRSGLERRGQAQISWLHEIDAGLTKKNTVADIRSELFSLREGDFVRIRNAHLFLPPYAAVVPKARYAASYRAGQIREPKRPLYAPVSERERADLDTYLKHLGADPGLPFVLPTLSADRRDKNVVTFFIPTRYTGLVDNARLLAGNLTVVGKVIYKDPRLPGGPRCRQPNDKGPAASDLECIYFDRQTLATFAPALEKAPSSVLASLGLSEKQIVAQVKSSVTFNVPVVVVLPVAIYQ